ncbi:hypothetical protein BASA60_001752 [Batrachochytrium salamandrivorans]|nr:hypothetical protein BASA60_001752 [Batrachochytrium salamandrivorans]
MEKVIGPKDLPTNHVSQTTYHKTSSSREVANPQSKQLSFHAHHDRCTSSSGCPARLSAIVVGSGPLPKLNLTLACSPTQSNGFVILLRRSAGVDPVSSPRSSSSFDLIRLLRGMAVRFYNPP